MLTAQHGIRKNWMPVNAARPLGESSMKHRPLLWLALLAGALGCGKVPSGQGRSVVEGDNGPALPNKPSSPPVIVTNSIGMKLSRIPAGDFLMGSAAKDPAARAD